MPNPTYRSMLACSIGVLVSVLPRAQGEDRTWLPTAGDWSDATNWSAIGQPPMQVVPLVTDNALFAGETTYDVTVSNQTIENLTSTATALNLHLAGPLTVTDTLSMTSGSLAFDGAGAANIGALTCQQLSATGGTRIKVGVAALTGLDLEGSTLEAQALNTSYLPVKIARGSTITSVNTSIAAAFSQIDLDDSLWDNRAGQFTMGYGLFTMEHGARLLSQNADLSNSGWLIIDTGANWTNTHDFVLHEFGKIVFEHGGSMQIGGNLLMIGDQTNHAGEIYLTDNVSDAPQKLAVAGKIACAGGILTFGAGSIVTSFGAELLTVLNAG